MLDPAPSLASIATLLIVTVALAVGAMGPRLLRAPPYLRYLWVLLLLLCVADWLSFRVAVWLFAIYAFVALREYFSLVDIRLQDRWGILGAYLSIPFMIYFIHINWYGMFIISIPVYTFLVIPMLVALGGGQARGTVFSIGAIDLGLFLFVYCIGHIGYLAFFSVRMALVLVFAVVLSDLVCRRFAGTGAPIRFALAAAGSIAGAVALAPWNGIPRLHSAMLGLLIPFMVLAGDSTMRVIEEDLGVARDRLEPGRGLVLDSLRAFLFPAPVVFHYLRWFLDWGRLPAP